jgi:hypothetical protein
MTMIPVLSKELERLQEIEKRYESLKKALNTRFDRLEVTNTPEGILVEFSSIDNREEKINALGLDTSDTIDLAVNRYREKYDDSTS